MEPSLIKHRPRFPHKQRGEEESPVVGVSCSCQQLSGLPNNGVYVTGLIYTLGPFHPWASPVPFPELG